MAKTEAPKPDRMADRVKMTVEIDEALWRRAKQRALDERSDLRTVITEALESHLKAVRRIK